MIKIVKNEDKLYCQSCGKRLPNQLLDIEINNGTKGYTISLCDDCMNQLGNMIYEKYMKETDFIKL